MRILILFFLTSSVVFAQIPFPQDTIAYNNRFNNREFADYNSQGLLRLTYTSGLSTISSLNEIYYVEEDAGGNFSTVNLTNNSVDDNYATLSIDQNDNVHISYEARDPSIFQVMYMHNAGGSFSAPIPITQGGLNKATPYGKIGPDSVMHFVYYTYINGADNVYYRSYDLKTSSLGSEVLLSDGEAGGDFEATLDIDSNGKVHIAARTGTTLFSGPMKYFNNVSGTFQEISTGVSSQVSYPRIRIDSNDKVHIVYRSSSALHYINNVGGSFSAPVVITPPGQLPAGIQSLEIDNQNRLYTTYQSSQSASGKGFYLLYAENGVFSDTILIADLPPEYVTRNSSQAVVNDNGEIAMFYAEGDVRNDTVICDIFMKRGNINQIIPVELVSFSGSVSGNDVVLTWLTSTETNNYGFEIERSKDGRWKMGDGKWEKIGFVQGNGTTTEIQNYWFKDIGIPSGNYFYRLKQIDFDGSINYSNIIEVNVNQLNEYSLEQNYPNPFNPNTEISFRIKDPGFVSLKVYDVLGKEVAVLINEEKETGFYNVEFNASHLSSGIYFYRLTIDKFSSVKKMILSK